ncbi:type II secretion system protein [Candidatus Uhrbacteria bacterium]|nr:type II secretion system protein [Candidatus Uhrbacteria bacterium]
MKILRSGNDRGFTLIELLIVIAIIGFLAAAILVAVDPVKRVQQSRDAKRWSEVNAILNAILTKQVDDRQAFAGSTTVPVLNNEYQIITSVDTGFDCAILENECPPAGVLSTTGNECVANLGGLVDEWIAAIPIDPVGTGNVPAGGAAYLGPENTGYYIHKTGNGRIEIGSCWPEQESAISVKR